MRGMEFGMGRFRTIEQDPMRPWVLRLSDCTNPETPGCTTEIPFPLGHIDDVKAIVNATRRLNDADRMVELLAAALGSDHGSDCKFDGGPTDCQLCIAQMAYARYDGPTQSR